MTGHRYGPHDPATAPDAITVGRSGTYAGAEVVPLHPALVRQRQVVNGLAHRFSCDYEGTPDDG